MAGEWGEGKIEGSRVVAMELRGQPKKKKNHNATQTDADD